MDLKKQTINAHVWCWDSAVHKHPHHKEIHWQQKQFQMFGLSEDKNHLKNTLLITDISSPGKYCDEPCVRWSWMGHILHKHSWKLFHNLKKYYALMLTILSFAPQGEVNVILKHNLHYHLNHLSHISITTHGRPDDFDKCAN